MKIDVILQLFCNYNEEYIIVSGGLQGSKVLDSVVRYDIA